jgi:hypothetical protein
LIILIFDEHKDYRKNIKSMPKYLSNKNSLNVTWTLLSQRQRWKKKQIKLNLLIFWEMLFVFCLKEYFDVELTIFDTIWKSDTRLTQISRLGLKCLTRLIKLVELRFISIVLYICLDTIWTQHAIQWLTIFYTTREPN